MISLFLDSTDGLAIQCRSKDFQPKSLVDGLFFCFSIIVSYSKCVCQHCGGHIEFPTEGAGQTIRCPHCQWNTVLTVIHTPQVEVGGGATVRKRVFLGFGLAAIVVAATGIGVLLWLKHTGTETQ